MPPEKAAAKNQVKLTKREVEQIPFAPPGAGASFYRDSEQKGFGLRVTANRKTYIAEYKVNGKGTRVTIGAHGLLTADEARAKAKVLLAQMSSGENPNLERKEARARAEKKLADAELTLAKLIEDYKRNGANRMKAQTLADYEKIMKRCFGHILDKPLKVITEDFIETEYRRLGAHPAQANLAMRVLRALLTYAIEAYRDSDGKPLFVVNPVRRLSRLRAWHVVERRENWLRDEQIRSWYEAVCRVKNDTMRDYLIVCLLTGLRRNEAASLEWKHIDLRAKTLKVTDTKNNRDHVLPMSDLLHSIFKRRWDSSKRTEFVFPGEGDRGHMVEPRKAIAFVAKETGTAFMIHDLRRTFVTIAERLDIGNYSLKRLVNHKEKSDVTAGYIGADVDRLREPMQKITDYIKKVAEIESVEEIGIAHAAKVVELKSAHA